MKLLLLTDMPPCRNFTAGLVLHQLCGLLPEGSVACFAVVNSAVDARLSSDLDWIPIEYRTKPREAAWRVLPGRLGVLSAFPRETYRARMRTGPLAAAAAAFGRDFGADAVWCVLQGQTMIRLATAVAKALSVPLLTQVWDPPEWWLRANGLDRLSRNSILADFDRALRSSKCCAAASWAMAEQYASQYGCKAVPIIPSLDTALAIQPAEAIHDSDDFVIGMAGQLYSDREWGALLAMLDQVDWKIAGRQVRIRLLGRAAWLPARGPMQIEFLGWRAQPEAIRLLSEADLLYCPYWFDRDFEKEARLSFPSKLTTYLAAGRPVLFHGPDYASPARFLKDNDAGLFCTDLNQPHLYNAIVRLIDDPNLYRKLTRNGHAAFLHHLTLETMKDRFAEFLGVDPAWLAATPGTAA